jgi:four helix bundle protein
VNTDLKNNILDLSFSFSLKIIEFSEELEQKHKYVFANQLLKSGTSIGANINEAQHAESKLDFIHKMKIAAKEIEETDYWLRLCKSAPNYPTPSTDFFENLNIIRLICSKIISTSKKSLNHESSK